MQLLSILFLASLLLGQIGGIPVYPGVVVYIHDILLVLLLTFGIRKFINKPTERIPVLTLPIILFIFAALISLFVNIHSFILSSLEIGSLYLVRWALYAALYFFVVQTYIDTNLWLLGLYAGGVGLAILGFLQFFLYPDLRNLSYLGWDPHYYRLFSTFLDPNFVGIYLVLTLFLGAFFWKNIKYRVWIAVCQVITFLALLFTYSRSSFLAFIAAILVIAAYKKKWALLLVIGAFVGVVIFLPKTSGSTLSLLRVDSSLARLGSWQDGVKLLGEAPVFGHGFDTLRYLTTVSPNTISKSAAGLDSSILFVGATAGIIGLVAYGYLIFSMIKIGRKHMFYFASIAAIGVHSFFVNSAFYPWVMIWMWILTGVVERLL